MMIKNVSKEELTNNEKKEGKKMMKISDVILVDAKTVEITEMKNEDQESEKAEMGLDSVEESMAVEDEIEGLDSMSEEYLIGEKESVEREELLEEVYLMITEIESEREELVMENHVTESIEEMEEQYWMEHKVKMEEAMMAVEARIEDEEVMEEEIMPIAAKIEDEEEMEEEMMPIAAKIEDEEEMEEEMMPIAAKIEDEEEMEEEMMPIAAKIEVEEETEEKMMPIAAKIEVEEETEEKMMPIAAIIEDKEIEEVSFKKPKVTKSLKYTISECKGSTRKLPSKEWMTIVNSVNGRKISLCKKWIDRIGSPSSIQVGYTDDCIVFSKQLHANKKESGYFMLRPQGGTYIVYCSDLVKEITDKFGLDFSNHSSITFHTASYEKSGKNTVAYVKVA